MSSSFTKAYKAARKEHRERSQPQRRKRLGLLEKGKDWAVRREDFHKKERRLKALALRARDRNPDEFYFGMVNAKTRDGVHQGKPQGGKVYSADEMKLLRTQDAGYVEMKRAHEEKKIGKMRASLHEIGRHKPTDEDGPKHTIFVDSKIEERTFDAAAHFDTEAALVDRAFNRPRRETLATQPVVGAVGAAQLKKMKAARQRQ